VRNQHGREGRNEVKRERDSLGKDQSRKKGRDWEMG
jgi:hypothetical protein